MENERKSTDKTYCCYPIFSSCVIRRSRLLCFFCTSLSFRWANRFVSNTEKLDYCKRIVSMYHNSENEFVTFFLLLLFLFSRNKASFCFSNTIWLRLCILNPLHQIITSHIYFLLVENQVMHVNKKMKGYNKTIIFKHKMHFLMSNYDFKFCGSVQSIWIFLI